jgi:hypothetical protein
MGMGRRLLAAGACWPVASRTTLQPLASTPAWCTMPCNLSRLTCRLLFLGRVWHGSCVQVTEDAAEALLSLGKLLYETGRYPEAARLLHYYTKLVAADSDAEKGLRGVWGVLACEVMEGRWESAADHVSDLSAGIEKVALNRNWQLALQQRSWLLHWALFVFFNKEGGLDWLLDFMLRDRLVCLACALLCLDFLPVPPVHLQAVESHFRPTPHPPCSSTPLPIYPFAPRVSNRNALQANCPWLMRYIVVAFILRRRPVLPALLSLIKEESYRDPVRGHTMLRTMHAAHHACAPCACAGGRARTRGFVCRPSVMCCAVCLCVCCVCDRAVPSR